MASVCASSPCRLVTGCNVILICLLSPCQVSPQAAFDDYGVKREAEEIEWDSSAEFTLLNAVTHTAVFPLPHTQTVLICCHVPELKQSMRQRCACR